MPSKKQILVVEDQDLLLMAIRDVLEMEGYAVVTASDGVEGLEMMENCAPALIIADISMPRMDGYKFFEAIHARPEWIPIPFVFLTARAEKEDRLKGKAMGAEDYLVKPFDPQELLVVVRSRIGRAEAIREATEGEFEELKQQIITLLSHELRTPLTSVYGYTELALEDAAQLPAGEFQQYLIGIHRGADRLRNLVEDLLMIVRLNTGQLKREFHILATVHNKVGDVVERTVKLYRAQAEKEGMVLETHIAPDLPPVRIYENFLADALGRLVDNAIKFSRKKGQRIEVTASAVQNWVEIAVTDEGIGISPAGIAHLFERFRQLDRDKMEQQGAGLGLVIVQALVNCMDGEITVESTVGAGSTFTIRLPAVPPA
ncbi:MAG TPA: response regulator [Anaerolineae bacterium]|mgnify:CR=1 FL=1|nr:response regulator [Anaerolineae bacterium]HQH37017.1 response regulator [Anaerolineae bacterium]